MSKKPIKTKPFIVVMYRENTDSILRVPQETYCEAAAIKNVMLQLGPSWKHIETFKGHKSEGHESEERNQ